MRPHRHLKLIQNDLGPIPKRARRDRMAYVVGFVALLITVGWVAFLGWVLPTLFGLTR
jgi:hypothetical protein